MKILLGIFSVFALIVTAGCASQPPEPGTANLQKNGDPPSFVWASPENRNKNYELHSTLLDSVVRVAITSQLQKNGLRFGKPANADLIVTYHALQMPSIPGARFQDGPLGLGLYSPEFWDNYYYPGNTTTFRMPTNIEPDHTTNSGRVTHILMIEVLDARNGKVLWRGWQQSGPEKSIFQPKRVPDVIDEILRGMPLLAAN